MRLGNLTGMVFLIAIVSAPAAPADEYFERWGPPIGVALPILQARDHTGRLRTFKNLAGKRGLLLFVNRSADW